MKILSILIMLVMIASTFIASAYTEINYDKKNNSLVHINDVTDIRVAIYTDEKEDSDFYGPYGRTRYFMYALDYSWKVGDRLYRFIPTLLSTKKLLRGALTTENYDVLLYPPDTADESLFYTTFSFLPRNLIREKRVVNFVKDGGGYFGTCGGAVIAGDLENRPKTFGERMVKNSCLGISCINVEFHTAVPLISQIALREPESIGTVAYLFYSSWNMTNMSNNYHSGACLDVPIYRDNPIFDDYLEATRKIRWIGAPPLLIPDPQDSETDIKILSTFPEEEISDNESIRINHWKYDGGLLGLFKAIIFGNGDINWMENLGVIIKALIFSGDWKPDKLVETNYKNQPFMTTECYPNGNKARIVRCVGHPEHNVWWGGHIEEVKDTNNNNLYQGLHYWTDIIPEEETIQDEFSYNYWIIRRSIAWASQKVSDNDLPTVYGPSQVSDIYPYEQLSNFIVEGNVETSKGITSLDLYYRYSEDNSSWSNWTLYDIDTDGSNGWNWEFNAPNGIGYYQFYSIRHLIYDYYTEVETAPTGPDAIAYISG